MIQDPTAWELLQDVLDAPMDDAPRLIMADYLEEIGELDRATFIRFQIKTGEYWPNNKLSYTKEQLNILKVSDAWRSDCSVLMDGSVQNNKFIYYVQTVYHRGFIYSISLNSVLAVDSTFRKLFSLYPIEKVDLTDKFPMCNYDIGYSWQSGTPPSVLFVSTKLPKWIFDSLSQQSMNDTHKYYDGPNDAIKDLSITLVKYGRSLRERYDYRRIPETEKGNGISQ